jgi:flagellar protein FlaG
MNVTATTANSPPVESGAGKKPQRPPEAGGSFMPVAGKSAPPERSQPPPATIDNAIEQIRTYLSESKRQLNFERDDSSGRTIIRVLDPVSGEVIRQIPSEEVLKIAAFIEAQGLHTFDELA